MPAWQKVEMKEVQVFCKQMKQWKTQNIREL